MYSTGPHPPKPRTIGVASITMTAPFASTPVVRSRSWRKTGGTVTTPTDGVKSCSHPRSVRCDARGTSPRDRQCFPRCSAFLHARGIRDMSKGRRHPFTPLEAFR